MHCSLTFELIKSSKNDFTKSWSDEQYSVFRKTFIQAVLATDMKQHFELTTKLTELKSVPVEVMNVEQKKLVYCAIVHAADLANPTMPPKSCYDWASRVVEEMYTQGKLEEKAGFVVAPFMRHPPSNTCEFAKLQLSFVGFIVAPLWKAMANMWPVLDDRIAQLESNNKFWESLRDKQEDY